MIKSIIKFIFKNSIGIEYLKYLQELFPSETEKSLREKRKLFYSALIPENGKYFDIGANFGNRIEPIINCSYGVVAIEPQKECINYLKLKFGNKIKIVPKGLGEKNEIKEMHIADNPVLSSFSSDWIEKTKSSGRFKKYKWNKVRKIEITTFDDLIEKYGKPDFAKIDVEGYELNVLKGLSQPINMVSLEYAAPEGIDLIEKCLQKLDSIALNSISCNYSVGESMEWAGDKWYSFEEMKTYMRSPEFEATGFGDIYVKST